MRRQGVSYPPHLLGYHPIHLIHQGPEHLFRHTLTGEIPNSCRYWFPIPVDINHMTTLRFRQSLEHPLRCVPCGFIPIWFIGILAVIPKHVSGHSRIKSVWHRDLLKIYALDGTE